MSVAELHVALHRESASRAYIQRLDVLDQGASLYLLRALRAGLPQRQV